MLRLGLSLLVQAMAVREAKMRRCEVLSLSLRDYSPRPCFLARWVVRWPAYGYMSAMIWPRRGTLDHRRSPGHPGRAGAPVCRLPRRRPGRRAASVDPAAGLSNLVDSVLSGLFRDHKATILLGAALLGLLSGRGRK